MMMNMRKGDPCRHFLHLARRLVVCVITVQQGFENPHPNSNIFQKHVIDNNILDYCK
jgi:hypothetical protein